MASTFSWVGNNIIVRYSQDVKLSDVENVNDVIFADPRFDQMRFQFNIFEKDAYFAMNEIEFQKMMHVEKASTVSNPYRMHHALVLLTKDTKLFEACLSYKQFIANHNWEGKIFNNKEKALNWIIEHTKLSEIEVSEFKGIIMT